ncbi:MAG TPA: hypothetical protein V6D43_12540 [Candidatus Sericytochromatia bacterium]|jgi:hypothetical protein
MSRYSSAGKEVSIGYPLCSTKKKGHGGGPIGEIFCCHAHSIISKPEDSAKNEQAMSLQLDDRTLA